jgi:DNA-binding XRE family transcriptional regulator
VRGLIGRLLEPAHSRVLPDAFRPIPKLLKSPRFGFQLVVEFLGLGFALGLSSSVGGSVTHHGRRRKLSLIERRPIGDRIPSILGVERKKPQDPRMRFGRRLAACRKERGWSQERLALESGIAPSYLGGVERGQRNIALLNICRLADALEITPSKLMAFD